MQHSLPPTSASDSQIFLVRLHSIFINFFYDLGMFIFRVIFMIYI